MQQLKKQKQKDDNFCYQDEVMEKIGLMHTYFLSIYQSIKSDFQIQNFDKQYDYESIVNKIPNANKISKDRRQNKIDNQIQSGLNYLKWLMERTYNFLKLKKFNKKKLDFRPPREHVLSKQIQSSKLRVSKSKAGISLRSIISAQSLTTQDSIPITKQTAYEALFSSLGVSNERLQWIKRNIQKVSGELILRNEKLQMKKLSEQHNKNDRNLYRKNIKQFLWNRYLVQQMMRGLSRKENDISFQKKYQNLHLYFRRRFYLTSYYLGERVLHQGRYKEHKEVQEESSVQRQKSDIEKEREYLENRKKIEDLLTSTEKFLNNKLFQIKDVKKVPETQQELSKYPWETSTQNTTPYKQPQRKFQHFKSQSNFKSSNQKIINYYPFKRPSPKKFRIKPQNNQLKTYNKLQFLNHRQLLKKVKSNKGLKGRQFMEKDNQILLKLYQFISNPRNMNDVYKLIKQNDNQFFNSYYFKKNTQEVKVRMINSSAEQINQRDHQIYNFFDEEQEEQLQFLQQLKQFKNMQGEKKEREVQKIPEKRKYATVEQILNKARKVFMRANGDVWHNKLN